jgi:hypothetical protein
MLFVTESREEVVLYNTIIGDDESLVDGYGYICLKKKNSQKIHSDRGNCQVYNFASKFIRENLFEAVEDTHYLGLELVASVQKGKLILDESQGSGVYFAVILWCFQSQGNSFVFSTGNHKSPILFCEEKKAPVNTTIIGNNKELISSGNCLHNVVNSTSLDIDIKMVFILVMIFVSAGGKIIQRHKMFIGNGATFDGGYGYVCPKKENSQEIHLEGKDRRVVVFVFNSFVSKDVLEAEVYVHQVQHALKSMVIEEGVVFYACKSSGSFINLKKFLLGSWLFNMFFKKFFRARVFSWLLFLLLCTVVRSDLFEVVAMCKFSVTSSMHDSGGGPKNLLLIHDGEKIRVVLISTMPLVESFHCGGEVCCSEVWFISWLSHLFASNYPPRWSNQIHYTHHRAPGSV